MPLKRRSPKTRGLSRLDEAQLVLLTGCVSWDADEWKRMRELWKIHGERLIREGIEKGAGPPSFLWEVDKARADKLMEDYSARFR